MRWNRELRTFNMRGIEKIGNLGVIPEKLKFYVRFPDDSLL